MAVPLGASAFLFVVDLHDLQVVGRASLRTRSGRTVSRTFKPTLMLGAKKIGVFLADSARAAVCSGFMPVVPTTMGLPARAHTAAEATEATGAVKSMTTAPGHLAKTVARSSPTTQVSPESPSVQPLRSSAPTRR